MKNQKGLAFIPVLLVMAIAGSFASGLVTVKAWKPEFHKEVLKTGTPVDYSKLNNH